MPYQRMQGGRASEVPARRAVVLPRLLGVRATGQAGTAVAAVARSGAATGARRKLSPKSRKRRRLTNAVRRIWRNQRAQA